MLRRTPLFATLLAALAASCSSTENPFAESVDDKRSAPSSSEAIAGKVSAAEPGPRTSLPPNELGRIPILEYHLIGGEDARWGRSVASFRADLELLYSRGYRPITVAQLIDKDFDLPKGTSPVVFTFDDASPGQFRYIEKDGALEIDSISAVGIWMAFSARHPEWKPRATFCVLPSAKEGHAFFGDKDIQGQKTAWRFPKLKFLVEQGFEICNHTLWHANLKKYPEAMVREQIARGVMAIDSAVPGYKVRTFALPLGVWPANHELAHAGEWTDPKSKRVVHYSFDGILNVSGGVNRSPFDPAFDGRNLMRVQVFENELALTLDRLDKGGRYVSDGVK